MDEWPEEKSIETVVDAFSYRLDERRLNAINPPELREKVYQYVIQPTRKKIIEYFQNSTFAQVFQTIKDYISTILKTGQHLDPMIKQYAEYMAYQTVLVANWVMEAYFIVRILKTIGNNPGPREKLGLKRGEHMTRIISYFGYGHIFNLKPILINLGFNYISGFGNEQELNDIEDNKLQQNQCLLYSLVSDAVESFIR